MNDRRAQVEELYSLLDAVGPRRHHTPTHFVPSSTGLPDPDQVAEVSRRLRANKELIEQVYGRPLFWEELSARRARRVADYTTGDVTDESEFGQYTTGSLTHRTDSPGHGRRFRLQGALEA